MILQAIDEAPQNGSAVIGYSATGALGEISYSEGRWVNAAGQPVEPRHFTPKPLKAPG